MIKTGITEIMITTSILSLFSAGAFGSFGALVHYLYTIVKDDGEYNFKTMLVFVIMGFFVSILVGSLMYDFFGRSYEGLLLLSGFLVLKILDFLNDSGLNIVLKKVGMEYKLPDVQKEKK